MTNVPQSTQTSYVRRLYDLANILQNLPAEKWDDPAERKAVLSGLATWTPVLREIAEQIRNDTT